MKTSIKSITAMMMAALVWTGCIDTEVSPEVKAIREQHVAILTAQARLAAADAEWQELVNAHKEAIDAFLVVEAEADLELALATIAEQVVAQQTLLAQEEKALADAVAALNKTIAEQGNVLAGQYLTSYQTAVTVLNNLLGDNITKAAELAAKEATLASANSNIDILREMAQEALDKQLLELEAKEAALVDLRAAAAGEVSNADLLATKTAANVQIEIDMEEKSLELETNVAAATAAGDAVAASETAIGNYDQAKADIIVQEDIIADAELDIIDAEDNITAEEDLIGELEAELAAEEAELAALEANLASLEAAFAPYVAAVANEEDDLPALEKALADAEIALDIAEAHFAAVDVDFDDGDPEYEAAETAVTTATTARNTAITNLDNAETEVTNAINERNATLLEGQINTMVTVTIPAAVLDVEGVEGDIAASEDLIEGYNQDIADAEVAIAEAELEIRDIEARMLLIFADQAAYDNAVAGLTALREAHSDAERAVDVTEDEIDALEAQWDANDYVIDALVLYFDNLEGMIDALDNDIEVLRGQIYLNEQAILTQNGLEAAIEAEIEVLEAQLAQINTQITAQQAIVAQRLALLNEALGITG